MLRLEEDDNSEVKLCAVEAQRNEVNRSLGCNENHFTPRPWVKLAVQVRNSSASVLNHFGYHSYLMLEKRLSLKIIKSAYAACVSRLAS